MSRFYITEKYQRRETDLLTHSDLCSDPLRVHQVLRTLVCMCVCTSMSFYHGWGPLRPRMPSGRINMNAPSPIPNPSSHKLLFSLVLSLWSCYTHWIVVHKTLGLTVDRALWLVSRVPQSDYWPNHASWRTRGLFPVIGYCISNIRS